VSRAPRILSVSYSDITRDARVLRQVDVLARHGEVTTLGYGEQPPAATHHLQVPTGLASLPQTPTGVARLAARRLVSAEMAAPGLAAGRRLVADEKATRGGFDLVVSNDARALPLAHEAAAGAPVWADMHEWAAEEFSHVTTWRLLVAPLMDHLCNVYLPRSAAVTTVCDSLAERYTQRYGVECAVVRNAGPWVDLTPTPVRDGLVRVTHSGGAVRGRNIEMLIDAVKALPHCTLDLFLVPAADGGRYLKELTQRAGGCDRVTLRDPVAPAQLPYALNEFDVGAFCMPPINVNAEFALPNKFFDFVQARLAQAVGPAREMARLVREHELGVVSADFGVDAFVTALRSLDRAAIDQAKRASHAAAHELSSARDVAVSDAIIERLLASRTSA
jgi:hypothetical protein